MRKTTALLATAAATLALAAPAQAANPYPGIRHLFNFGSSGAGAGQLNDPAGIAINHTTGDVYVADRDNNRIDQFDADGNFIRAWGKDVVASGPDDTGFGFEICDKAANPSDVCKAGVASFAAGSLDTPTGIAVDNSGGPAAGSVYVQERGNYRIQRFTAGGQFVLTWGKGVNGTSGGDVCTAASGDLCVRGATESGQQGGFDGWFSQGVYASQIATDAAGRVYVGTGVGGLQLTRVQRFDSTGAFLDQIAETLCLSGENFCGALGIATDANGGIYLIDGRFPVIRVKRYSSASFTPSGVGAVPEATLDPDHGFFQAAVAVDPSNQYVLFVGLAENTPCRNEVAQTYYVAEYHPGGQLVDCSPATTPGIDRAVPHSLAISPTHRLYMSVGHEVRVFATPVAAAPEIGAQSVAPLSHSAAVKAPVTANLADTDVHVEYGSAGRCSGNACLSTDTQDAGASLAAEEQSIHLDGLEPDTTYHYRVVADNGVGPAVAGPEAKFHTYPAPLFDPSCPNNLARQQTGAAFLDDCRAYELVSAQDAGGYDVESSLLEDGEPFGGYPDAKDKALYALHNGTVPGVGGNPTNKGPDPYIATRDAENQRWETTYVGLPADAPGGPLASDPFSSSLLGADGGLASFAFGGDDICDPCFADGSTGIPVRKPDGSLVQGMRGPIAVADPTPLPDLVKEPFSADGRHLLFASKQRFVPGAHDNGTDATIYDRNLKTGLTQIVSTNPASGLLRNGEGIAALDISADGTRILIGTRVGTDAQGSSLYDLYMHEGTSPFAVEVADTPNGVLPAGMTKDGSQVFFTTPDQLADDTDASADLFRVTLDGGSASVERVSLDPSAGPGGVGDRDDCDSAGNSAAFQWNGAQDCSVLGLGGGGGVASDSGAVYFLSPEDLDGNGTPGAPNLYLGRPGQSPKFVATLESSFSGPQPPTVFYPSFANLPPILTRALGLAVDRANGYLYVLDFVGGPGNSKLKKYDLAGNPVNFTAGQGAGTNALNGSDAPSGAFAPSPVVQATPAVDPTSGKVYVPDFGHGVVDVFNPDGSYDSQLVVASPSAAAVDPTTGDVHVTTKAASGRVTVFPAGGGASSSFSVIANPTGIAVDSTGAVYVVNGTQTLAGAAAVYDSSGAFLRNLPTSVSTAVAVDPAGDDVFVNEKDSILQFDSAGDPTGGSDGQGAPLADADFSGSLAIAVGVSGKVYASNNNSKLGAFPASLKPNPSIDNPLVIDALTDPYTPHSADFQTTSSGEYAAFPSVLDLAGSGYDSAGHSEVFRYDEGAGQLRCASCSPTLLAPASDASLPVNGRGIEDSGAVFFDTAEALVLRDVNGKRDAYQWDGAPQLISSGTHSSDSALLSVTHDGTDAFFFTRETLVEGDRNGNHVKLYDARAGGGFFVVPPPPSCVASDECHGPGSEAAPRAPIGTVTGTGGNLQPAVKNKPRRCPRGKRKVRRGGKVRCVRPKAKRKHRAKHRRAKGKREVRPGGRR